MNTLVGVQSARSTVTEYGPTKENAAERAVSLPCADDPRSWDVDVARPAELIMAAEQCIGCPIFAACDRQAQSGPAMSMVWAGTIYDQDGNPVPLATVRSWVRRHGIVNRPNRHAPVSDVAS